MSEVKVNKISPRTNCGTVTLGDSGDTFTIPSGATITNSGTASGFGATGEISWDTTVKTTGAFTPTAGVGYFLNTTGGIITVNLAAGTAGDSVALADYAGTWQTNNVTLAANGTEKIGGVDADVTLATEGQSVTFVYIDGTQGWVNVLDSTSNVRGFDSVKATGGCITTCGDYKMHTFTGPGTFWVSAVAVSAPLNLVDYLVIGGGGGGGHNANFSGTSAGAGGAGGYRESPGAATGGYTVSPLGAAPAAAVTVTVQGYPIVAGGGGPGANNPGPANVNGTKGTDSSGLGITSTGGGYGSGAVSGGPGGDPGGPGGSGGGGTYDSPGGTGNTPPFSPAQGQNGGNGGDNGGASGGGAGGAAAHTSGPSVGAAGVGAGTAINLTTMPAPSPTPSAQIGTPGPSPSVRYFAGGGGGGSADAYIPGGYGGGGTGGYIGNDAATVGTINTGGGGGGGDADDGPSGAGANGGSGIVVLRYKYQ